MKRQIEVKLKSDLSRYAQGLLPGVEGHTIGQYGVWSRGSDRFISVCFPGIATLDVLWESLEIVDKEYFEEAAMFHKKQMEELKSARNVIKCVGPKGGFRYLIYEHTSMDGMNIHTTNGFKRDADKLIEVFKQYGICVEIKTER